MTTPRGAAEPDTKLLAHEVVAEPGEDASLRDRTRYHLARALGLTPGFDVPEAGAEFRHYADRVLLWVTESRVALLYVALDQGLAGDEAERFVHARCHEEAGEWLWQYAVERDIDPERIRPYLRPDQRKAAGQ